jgi:hypothetical protein
LQACLANWPEGVKRFKSGELLKQISDRRELARQARRLHKDWKETPSIGLALLLCHPRIVLEASEEQREALTQRVSRIRAELPPDQDSYRKTSTQLRDALERITWLSEM